MQDQEGYMRFSFLYSLKISSNFAAMEKIKFLIIRFSSIGDIVLTTPVVRNLKQQCEGAEIHYVTKKEYVYLLEHNPYIDKIHTLDKSLSALAEELRKEYFLYIIDLHNNLRTFRLKNKLRTSSFAFNKLNKEKWLMVNFKKNKLPDIHIVDRYMKTISFFIDENDMQGLDYFIPAKDEFDINKLPESHRNGYIAFAIGGQHFTKRMPESKIQSVCKLLKLPIVLLGDKNDAITAKEIEKNIGKKIYNACGKYNLNQSASLVKQSKLLITHDTGLMHIAAAFKKRIVSIWGNTIPEFGMYPYLSDKDSAIVQVENLKCRPCSKIGFKKCPKKHFKCMNNIDEGKLAELCNSKI